MDNQVPDESDVVNNSSEDIKKKEKIGKKKKTKKQKKEVKKSDIISCITFLSRGKKKKSLKGSNDEHEKYDAYEEYEEYEKYSSDYNTSDGSSNEEKSHKHKKKRKKGKSKKYEVLENIFNDEREYKKNIVDDNLISKDKKYVYEDELNIEENDSIVINGKIYSDMGTIEIHIFNYDEDIFNIYDDVIIDNYPLCIEAIYQSYFNEKNILAVGTLNPSIQLWDINNIDMLEPLHFLGDDEMKILKKKNKKKRKLKNNNNIHNEKENVKNISKQEIKGHTDCVTSLNSSKLLPSLLVSGSKDSTIKLWDLNNLNNLHTFSFHKKKINNLSFHSKDKNILFSTSSDKTLKIYDIRQNKVALDIHLSNIPEATIWNTHEENIILSSYIDGFINKIDIRYNNTLSNKPHSNYLINFKSFEKSCTSLLSTHYKNLTLAASEDGIIKAYDFNNIINEQPHCVYSKNLKKNLFYMKDNEDWPNVVFLGCDKLYDWDLFECEEIKKYFNL
ncbi:rRNA processing WD-repeat protein, putative [Plasmodium gaboni]|uniref:rRNA processing WD-repeat protein, putative n=1 Tax=Plasmodium gaboni TaxID=647221 RepID=A0ABY1UQQ9_9APIC|nr:rRNA processing WD-repeat protein, putative [Plasmodium gaboni]